ncbi:hypothetical protein DH2020_045317 [Rehmannia glutinosa]|uniref:Glycine-rich protein n=1 Tax=Rehmannia glutinosa TaxID=99300 RepID=A0ABR0UEH8_REHGL
MGSKVIVFLVLFLATVLLISSQAAARDLAETSETVDSSNEVDQYGGGYGGGGRGGYGGGRGGYGGGRGGYGGGRGGYGGGRGVGVADTDAVGEATMVAGAAATLSN